MRISDWSSDVCSSDLLDPRIGEPVDHPRLIAAERAAALEHQRDLIGKRQRLRLAARARMWGIGHFRQRWLCVAARSLMACNPTPSRAFIPQAPLEGRAPCGPTLSTPTQLLRLKEADKGR